MKNRVFACVAVIVAACSLIVSAAVAEVVKSDLPGIKNFSRIEGAPGFAGAFAGFGGATLPAAMAPLQSAGFAAVINLRLADEEGVDIDESRAAAEAAGLRYIHLPFDVKNPDPAVVEEFLAIVGDQANQPVYIHCNSATRAAALWMVGRVLEDQWAPDTATAEVELIALKPADAIAFATAYIASQAK